MKSLKIRDIFIVSFEKTVIKFKNKEKNLFLDTVVTIFINESTLTVHASNMENLFTLFFYLTWVLII